MKNRILKIMTERKKARMAWHYIQRAVWHNGGCASLESVAKQQVMWLVASAGSPPLRQAATTLYVMAGHVCVEKNIFLPQLLTMIFQKVLIDFGFLKNKMRIGVL